MPLMWHCAWWGRRFCHVWHHYLVHTNNLPNLDDHIRLLWRAMNILISYQLVHWWITQQRWSNPYKNKFWDWRGHFFTSQASSAYNMSTIYMYTSQRDCNTYSIHIGHLKVFKSLAMSIMRTWKSNESPPYWKHGLWNRDNKYMYVYSHVHVNRAKLLGLNSEIWTDE